MPVRLRRLSALAAMAGLACVPSKAESQAHTPVDWRAPAACPDAASFDTRVRRLVSETPPEPAPSEIRATVTRESDVFVAHIEIDGGRSERTLRAARCDELASAAALVVALAIDPGAVSEKTDEQAPPQRHADEPEGATWPWHVGMQLMGGFEWWTAPNTEASAALRLSADVSYLALALEAQLAPPRTYEARGRALRLWRLGGAVLAGVGLRREPWSAHAMTVLRVSRLAAEADGSDQPEASSTLLLELGTELRAALSISSRTSATLAIAGGPSLRRPRLEVINFGTVHQPGAGWLRTSLGLHVRLR